jgi:hypothetical protein
MRITRGMAALLAGLLIAGCGGGGGSAGTPPFNNGGNGGTGGSTAANIEVVASSNRVGTADSPVTITAIVKDSGNASLASEPVTFSTDTGTLTSPSATTDAAGVATAGFSAGSDKTNRPATITVRAGGATGTITLPVDGTTLVYSGPTTLPLGGSAPLSIKATDSGGNPIANAEITVSSALSNGLSATSLTTDAQGQANVTYTATSSGTDDFSFSGLGATPSPVSISISGEDFAFISPAASTQIAVGTSRTLQVRYRENGAPQVGQQVNFAATAGTLSSASVATNAQGIASVTISSTSASPSTVQATLASGTAQASLPLFFVATTPSKLVLQVSPSAIGPNGSGSTTSQAQVLAKVTDVNGNPVPGKTVNFSRDVDPSGGNLQQPSAVTDINGQATVQYIAGAQSTASNGVVLRGTVAGTLVTDTEPLTISQSALFIALGTGNTIQNLDEETYKKDWVAYVTDANGVAVSGVTLTIKVLPLTYLKGRLTFVDPAWVYDANSPTECPSEDANQNGVLDAAENDGISGAGNVIDNADDKLWPGNVISVTPGSVQTDANGRAKLSLIYAESYVPWVSVRLTVTAVVSGTESRGEAEFLVDGLASDFNSEDVAPAGVVSPFGTATACTNPN